MVQHLRPLTMANVPSPKWNAWFSGANRPGGDTSVCTTQVDNDSRDFWGHTYALGDLSGTVTSGSSSRGRRLDGQEQGAVGRLPLAQVGSWELGGAS